MGIFLVMESPVNDKSLWNGVCLVGFGSHARLKLLPAINSAGIDSINIVTSKFGLRLPGVRVFSKLADAIRTLPVDTLFVVATPPRVHYSQVKALIDANRDVFVEKPAFLCREESSELSSLATERGLVLAEMLMYLENRSVNEVINELKSGTHRVRRIECQFLIPAVPNKTFRTEVSLGNSLLSDMGCYPLSLLATAGYDIRNINLMITRSKAASSPMFTIEGKHQNTDFHIQVGCDSKYTNKVRVDFDGGLQVTCEPFFYGRKGERTVASTDQSRKEVRTVYESDAYKVMFLRPRRDWIMSQRNRIQALDMVSEVLERLGNQAGLRHF